MIHIKRKKIVTIVRFLVCAVISVVIFFGIYTLSDAWRAKFVTQHTKRTLVIIVDFNQREKFFEQLRKFADVNSFEIQINPLESTGDIFNINMSRKDVVVIGDNVFDSKRFDIDFYDQNPNSPVPDKIIDSLLNDLKGFIKEIPNVTITELP